MIHSHSNSLTLKLKDGVTAAQFESVDDESQTDYISKRAGFLSSPHKHPLNLKVARVRAWKQHDWSVIVHWRSITDADASMKNFSKRRRQPNSCP
jgi:hypothetical protein